ncbi:proteophosphoglycan related protein [Cystoisospora suis]|uniref:Proteophosphoglycan related protein n=1 Tax=Cystoisospora suis TaxID=483139 RepID=A0A2C6KLK1_9APIC|nr:proteophosphoglycan related protein [Cystoisospora suis]
MAATRKSLMRGFRTASRVMEGSWKTALVRSFLSDEQLDDLDIPEEEIADYIIKQIVPFVKAHLLDAMKATNDNFDQFVVNRLADQGILAVEQQEKIMKVMQVLAAAKTQISNQSDTLDAQQLKITELSERLEEASQYLEERANDIEDNALKEVSWKREQARKSEEKFPTEAVSALRGLEEELAESQREKAENKTVHEDSHSGDEEPPLPRSPPSATESGAVDFSPVSKQMEKVAREALAEILPLLSRILENVGKTSRSLSYRVNPP